MITLDPALPSGAYTVQWRVIAQDGHVMRGNFGFEVRAE
jgi:methionine-rich copper-binding protein CopC